MSILLNFLLFLLALPAVGMRWNVLKVGATRMGKTLSAVSDMLNAPDEATVILDPHMDSLAASALIHAEGNILACDLSDIAHPIGFDLLVGSRNPDPARRQLENHLRAEAFVQILLRRRAGDGMAGTPLMEEHIMGAIQLFLHQRDGGRRLPPRILRYAFTPGTAAFEHLVRNCTISEIRAKFRALEKLTPRALRSEVGSATRLLGGIFSSPAFAAWSSGGFNLGSFLQAGGKLIVQKGNAIGDDTMRTIMGSISLLTIDHAKRRPKPWPPIRIRIDEATNAGLVGSPELKGIAETSKNGLNFDFYVQNLDFPGGSDGVLQNCLRHEWFGCPFYDLARKGAVDIASGLPIGEESRAERIASLTNELMNLKPGWRWVRDPSGSRKEYVPLLEHPWPDWPGLREAKLQEKLQWIYSRKEYQTPVPPSSGEDDMPESTTSSDDTPPRPSSSPGSSSAAKRWKQSGRKRPDGSSRPGDGSESK